MMLSRLQPTWSIMATPADLPSLRSAIENTVPHVLLVDIHMPGDPLDDKHWDAEKGVLNLLGSLSYRPAVILVTGDPGLAIDAFELSVTDYIVKPVKPSRLQVALERAREAVRASFKTYSEEPGSPERQGLDWITATRGLDSVLVLPKDVVFLQAERKYTRLLLVDGEALVRIGISQLEEMLDERHFLRVHRSTIVNVHHIQLVRRDEMGRLRVHLNGRPERLNVSKPFEPQFKTL
jgi:DNA-binding LytR/AlgR family response regulator